MGSNHRADAVDADDRAPSAMGCDDLTIQAVQVLFCDENALYAIERTGDTFDGDRKKREDIHEGDVVPLPARLTNSLTRRTTGDAVADHECLCMGIKVGGNHSKLVGAMTDLLLQMTENVDRLG